MAELIPWAEVPEGHYVWARNKSRSGEWFLVSKVDGRCRVDIGTVLNTNLYEFARAEQQPGDAAYWHAESTKDCKRADKADADLATLRAGIAALEQEMRKVASEQAYGDDGSMNRLMDTAEDWADRLAALRDGRG